MTATPIATERIAAAGIARWVRFEARPTYRATKPAIVVWWIEDDRGERPWERVEHARWIAFADAVRRRAGEIEASWSDAPAPGREGE